MSNQYQLFILLRELSPLILVINLVATLFTIVGGVGFFRPGWKNVSPEKERVYKIVTMVVTIVVLGIFAAAVDAPMIFVGIIPIWVFVWLIG